MSTLEHITVFRALDSMSPAALYQVQKRAATRRDGLLLEVITTFLEDDDRPGSKQFASTMIPNIEKCEMYNNEQNGPELRLLCASPLLSDERVLYAFRGGLDETARVDVYKMSIGKHFQAYELLDCDNCIDHPRLCWVRTLFNGAGVIHSSLDEMTKFAWWVLGFWPEIHALILQHTSSNLFFYLKI